MNWFFLIKVLVSALLIAGFFSSAVWHKQYPRLQIYTVAELLDGRQVERPPTLALDETYKRAPKAKPEAHEQPGLGL
jgi:hypothetical protein